MPRRLLTTHLKTRNTVAGEFPANKRTIAFYNIICYTNKQIKNDFFLQDDNKTEEKTMIYVTGDTHGDLTRFKDPQMKKLSRGDTLIICGDFGFIWDNSPEEKKTLQKLGERKHLTLFVEGTHENFSLLATYPICELFGARARHICGNLYQLLRGEIYTIEGSTFFAFGGGDSDDKELRMRNGTWWREEQPSIIEMQYAVENLDKARRRVDYIITHQPSLSDMARVDRKCRASATASFFDELSHKVRYKKWFFGSLHKDKKLPKAHCLFTDVVKI